VRSALKAVPESCSLSYLPPGHHVIASDIVTAVRAATHATGLYLQGYTPLRIGSHSLSASGATALNGEDEATIMIDGVDQSTFLRWS
jgi:hypothetical protein